MTLPKSGPSSALDLACRVAGKLASLPQVEAVALAGSRTSAFPDQDSDVDLYVYVTEDVPVDLRAGIAAGSPRAEIGNATWEPGDEWIDGATGTRVDVMYRHVRWIEEQLDRVLVRHEASVGYSTCFWYNVLHSQSMFDRSGWFAGLQRRTAVPYPTELRRAIIAKNHPLLRHNQSSYMHQIELAVKRSDPVSVNHRVGALLASYFDVLFAVNEQPHPGEKRLLQHAARCAKSPRNLERQVNAVLESDNAEVGARISVMIDSLDEMLRQEKLQGVTCD